MFSYFEPNFIEKVLWESGFSNFWPKSKSREIKIGYLAAILKRYNIFNFFFFCRIVIFIVHMVQISLQNSAGKVVFYGWVPRNPPLGTNGSKSTLVT